MRGHISILALVVLLAACGDDTGGSTAPTTTQVTTTSTISTATSTSTSTTQPPVTTTTTTSTVPVAAYVWSRIPGDEAVFGGSGVQVMRSVAIGGPGLVAVGWDDSGADLDAAVWTSVDGVTWARVADRETVFGGSGSQMAVGVAVGGPGLVAVGLDDSGGDFDAAVWTSVDGVTWTKVPGDEGVFGGRGGQDMLGVVTGGPGLVAVGGDWVYGGDWNAAVWTSVDGFAWIRVPHDEDIFGGTGNQTALGVTAGGPHGLVAVGSEFDRGTGDSIAAVWVSDDGLTWARVRRGDQFASPSIGQGPVGAVGFSAEMSGVVVAGPGLVAVGHEGKNTVLNAAVWVSVDGYDWTRIEDPDVLGGTTDGEQRIYSVTTVASGLVAVGSDAPSPDDVTAAMWFSADGLTWTRVPYDEAVFGSPGTEARGVAAWDLGVVVVGSDHPTQDDTDAAVWIGTIPG